MRASLTLEKKRVCAIIVHYDMPTQLLEQLTWISKLPDFASAPIYVVDNSRLESMASYLKEFPRVELIQPPSNLGYSGGVNFCLSNSKVAEHEHALVLGTDVFPQDHCLSEMLSTAESDESIAIVGCKILDRDTGAIDSEGGYLCFPFGIALPRKEVRGWNTPSKEFDVAFVGGAIMLIKVAAVTSLGSFDASFFAYYEEVDICWRARLAGYRVVCTSSALAYHTRTGPFSKLPERKLYLNERNRITSSIKNLSTPNLFLFIICEAWYAMLYFSGAILTDQPQAVVSYLSGIKWNLLNIRQISANRTQCQASRVYADSTVLELHRLVSLRVTFSRLRSMSTLRKKRILQVQSH